MALSFKIKPIIELIIKVKGIEQTNKLKVIADELNINSFDRYTLAKTVEYF